MDSQEKKKASAVERGQLILAIVAFCVSLFTFYQSDRQATRSNKTANGALQTANEALETARMANSIALGTTREYPVIDVRNPEKDPLQLRTIDDVRTRKSELLVRNEGPLPIAGFQLDLIGLSGLTISLQHPSEEEFKEPFNEKRTSISIEEQMLPGSWAFIDLRIPILRYLKDLNLPYKYPDGPYRMAISVIVLPKAVGQEAPLQTATLNKTKRDRDLFPVEYVPRLVASPEADAVSHEQPKYRVYPP